MYDVTVHASKTSHSRVRGWLLLTVWHIAPGSGQSACLDTCCALQQKHMACAGLASRCIKCTDTWIAFRSCITTCISIAWILSPTTHHKGPANHPKGTKAACIIVQSPLKQQAMSRQRPLYTPQDQNTAATKNDVCVIFILSCSYTGRLRCLM